MKIRVRKAVSQDLNFFYLCLCELEDETLNFDAFQSIYLNNIKNEDCLYCLLEEDNQPVALITLHAQMLLHHVGRIAEIQEFYVLESHRGHGYGKLLFSEMMKLAESMGLSGIEVTSNKKRIENIDVYQKLGFQLTHNKFTKKLI